MAGNLTLGDALALKFPEGTRVRLLVDAERLNGEIFASAGETGVVTCSCLDYLVVHMDTYHPCLDEWGNDLIWNEVEMTREALEELEVI